jgi:hypothetical protein
MAEATSSGPGESIYTVLVFVSLLALLAGVGYVFYRGSVVFGGYTWFLPGS